jgi:hypothetical protein
VLGDRQLRALALQPSLVQAWVRGLQQQLAPNYVRVVFANVSAVFQAAMDDGLISKNPCRAGSVKPPAPDRRKVIPWTSERVVAVRAGLPERYAAMTDVGPVAGCAKARSSAWRSRRSISCAAYCTSVAR